MKNPINASAVKKKLARKKQRETLRTLQKLLNSSLDVICAIDLKGRFVTVSAASKAVWGYTPEELIGTCYLDLVVEADRQQTEEAGQKLRAGLNLTNFENHYICKDGSIKPILWSARWDEAEQITYCVAKDNSEKKKGRGIAKAQ